MKFKEYFKVKAKMIDHEAVEEEIGHPVGGGCPFEVKENVEVFLDESIFDLEAVISTSFFNGYLTMHLYEF